MSRESVLHGPQEGTGSEPSAAPPKTLSKSAQERARKREVRRREQGHQTDQSWRDHTPRDHTPRPNEPSPRFLRATQVMEITTLSRSELYTLIAEKRFPPSFKLTGTTGSKERGGAVVWFESEVIAWMASRRATV